MKAKQDRKKATNIALSFYFLPSFVNYQPKQNYLRAYTGTMNNQIYIWGEKNRVNSNAFCLNKRVDNTFFVDLIILVGRVILLMPLLHYLEELFFVA